MGIIQDTLAAKAAKDLEPIAMKEELTEAKIDEVLTELRKGTVETPYTRISRLTGVSEADIEEIHQEMNSQLTK